MDTETEDDTVKITALSRRHVLVGAAATVAAAALPAAVVAEASKSWSMQFVEEAGGWRLLSWQPNTFYAGGQIVMYQGRRVFAKCSHVSMHVFRTQNWLLLDDIPAVRDA